MCSRTTGDIARPEAATGSSDIPAQGEVSLCSHHGFSVSGLSRAFPAGKIHHWKERAIASRAPLTGVSRFVTQGVVMWLVRSITDSVRAWLLYVASR
jgi:hypothetical protein